MFPLCSSYWLWLCLMILLLLLLILFILKIISMDNAIFTTSVVSMILKEIKIMFAGSCPQPFLYHVLLKLHYVHVTSYIIQIGDDTFYVLRKKLLLKFMVTFHYQIWQKLCCDSPTKVVSVCKSWYFHDQTHQMQCVQHPITKHPFIALPNKWVML